MFNEEPRQLQELRECGHGIRRYVGELRGIDLPPDLGPYAAWPGDANVVEHETGHALRVQHFAGPSLIHDVEPIALQILRLAWIDMEREVLMLFGDGEIAQALTACERDLAIANDAQALGNAEKRLEAATQASSDDFALMTLRYLRQRNIANRAQSAARMRRELVSRLPSLALRRLYDEPANVVLARFCYHLDREGIDRVTIATMLGLHNPRHAGCDPDKAARDNVGSRIRWLERKAAQLGCQEALAS